MEKKIIKEENIMGTMPIGPLLLKMSLPMIISMLVQSIYNVVDSIFVSRLSEEALTAVSLAFPVQNIMLAFSIGIGVGAGALLSRYLGMKDKKRVGYVAMHGFILAGITYIIFAILGLLFSQSFAKGQTQSPLVYAYTKDYLTIVTVFSVGIFFQVLTEKLLQSTSLTFYTMVVQVTGALVNLILDPILIFGLFGFPRLEVKGAALATIIGQIAGAILGLILNKVKNKEIEIDFKKFKLHGDILKQIFWIGLPSIVMTSVSSVVIFVINSILQSFGQSAIAAYGVMFKLQSFAFLPVIGLSNAIVSIVSYNYGARYKKRIKKSIKLALISGLILVAIAASILWSIPNQLLDIFQATDKMRRIGVPMIRTVSLSLVVAAISIVSVGVFQALGNWKSAILQSILRQVIIILPVFYFLSLSGNIDLVWWAFLIAEIINALVCAILLKRDIRLKIDTL
ncbi:MAG: MATE family efflux transporter [Anaerococcus sp.]|nr:MATE family efflux transporter [Anaerococcus sp.]